MATPLSGEYLRTRNTDTAPTNVAGYGTYHTSAAGVPKYRTAAGVEYAVNPSGPNTITVGVLGDYTTIAAAIVAAAARTPTAASHVVILLQPGTYTLTGVSILPANVDLIGTNETGVVITGNDNTVPPGWYTAPNALSSALINAAGNNTIQNIKFVNLRTIYPSVCLIAGAYAGHRTVVRNCQFIGGGADALYTYTNNGGEILIENCDILDATDSISMTSQTVNDRVFMKGVRCGASGARTLWMTGSGRYVFDDCYFYNTAGNGIVHFSNTQLEGTVTKFTGCSFMGANDLPGKMIDTVAAGTNYVLGHANCVYDSINYAGADITVTARDKPVVAYLDSVGGLKIAGTERIASTGEVKSVGLNTTVTQWRYFDAIACGRYDLAAWTITSDAYMTSTLDGDKVYFSVPYEPGSIITRVSVRSQGAAANDGVILTLQKRLGGTAAAAWATVGAAQTYVSASEINNVYDVADETMAAGYEYRVIVESQIGTTSAKVWEIGIETSKRAY